MIYRNKTFKKWFSHSNSCVQIHFICCAFEGHINLIRGPHSLLVQTPIWYTTDISFLKVGLVKYSILSHFV